MSPLHEQTTTPVYRREEPDPSAGFRTATASIGLVLIVLSALLCMFLFWRIYQVLMDPRPLADQVDRWEFVLRGKATDAPIPVERPVMDPTGQYQLAEEEQPPKQPFRPATEAEAVAQIAGRVGSKAARPAAILIMLMLLGVIIRIVLGLMDVGGRLVHHAGSDKELLQRLVREITERRQ